MHREKGKKKMSEYDTDSEGLDRSESDPGKGEGRSSQMKPEPVKKGLKPGNG